MPRTDWGFSPCGLLSFQKLKTPAKCIGGSGQSSANGVSRDIVPIARDVGVTVRSHLGVTSLPDLSRVTCLFFQAKGKSSFDELHGLFNGRVTLNRNQQMHMVRHDDEVPYLKTASRNAGSQYVDEQHGIAVRLQKSPPHARFGCNEERARIRCAGGRADVSEGFCHRRG
jgi:hypothetical protein